MKEKELMRTDLSKREGSMSNIIEVNHDRFDACTNTAELISTLKAVFKENNLNTPASKRLIANVAKHGNNFTSALLTVYDSYLYGSKLAVDQK